MDNEDLINYWIETSNKDYNTMLNLFDSKDYHWSLFIGHLVIEKLLKAIIVKNANINPPRIHDLLRLADIAKIHTNEVQKDDLDLITTFNINARYPDFKHSFYKKCNYNFTIINIKKIEEMRAWLLLILENE